MRKLFLGLTFVALSAIFSVLVLSVSAQNREARLIDEVGDMPCGDYEGRLDLLLAQTTETENSIAVVMYYEGKYTERIESKNGTRIKISLPTIGEVEGRIRWLQNYVIGFRRFPKEKIRFISGGYRENSSMDLWIVPRGAALPQPSKTVETIKFRKGKPTYFHCV